MPTRNAAPLVLLLLISTVLAACGGTREAGSTPGTTAAPTDSGAPESASPGPSGLVNLAVDACTFLDLATVRGLTGVSESYATDSDSEPNAASCFWGATKPGFPGYVEVRVFRQTSLSAYTFGEGCSVTPIDGVGDEAAFVECPPSPQVKISMLAFERGVIASLLVNEPAGPLTAEDLGTVIESVFDQLP